MSHGPTTFSQGSAQGQGSTLSLYETAAAEVGDDTARSSIIQRIVAITQAAANGGAAEAGMDEEADTPRSQGGHSEDKATGSVDGRTVLARVSMQPGINHATTDTG